MPEKIESVMRAHRCLRPLSHNPDTVKLIEKDRSGEGDLEFAVLYMLPPSREKSKLLDGRLVKVTVEVVEE